MTPDREVRWSFNPPAEPHFKGAHKIMVRAAEKAIPSVLENNENPDEDLILRRGKSYQL